MSVPQEHDYITCLLSEAPPPPLPPPTEKLAAASDLTKKSSNGGGGGGDDSLILRETELRLGLPGSHSPSLATIFMSGSKRGFTEAIDLCEGVKKEVGAVEEEGKQGSGDNDNNGSPASKGQVVGWPPIRSFRKSTMASNLAKNDEDAEGNMGFGCLYVKVSMEGAPYLRKVDLKTYSNYMELSSALEKMFSCFTIGKCSSQGLYGRDGLNETSLKNLLHDSENVLTYEGKDGDWMLVGDVPWEVFTESCKKLRIIKGSEAIGLAPRAMEKCNARTATDKAFLTALQISSRANCCLL